MIKVRTILENSVLVEPGKNKESYVLNNLEEELVEYMNENDYMQLKDFVYEVHPAHNSFEREISVEVEVEKK